MIVFNDALVPVYNPVNDSMQNLPIEEGTIIIDNSLLEDGQIRRGRFTQGHEIARWFLHRHIYLENKNQMTLFDSLLEPAIKYRENKNQMTLFDSLLEPAIKYRNTDIERSTKRELVTDEDWMEWQADYMASTLLMPKFPFRKAVSKLFREAGIRNDYYEIGTDDDYDLWAQILTQFLADIFDVSVTAATIKLQNFDFIRYKQTPYNVRLIP